VYRKSISITKNTKKTSFLVCKIILKIIIIYKIFKNCWSRTNLCQLRLQLRLHSNF